MGCCDREQRRSAKERHGCAVGIGLADYRLGRRVRRPASGAEEEEEKEEVGEEEEKKEDENEQRK